MRQVRFGPVFINTGGLFIRQPADVAGHAPPLIKQFHHGGGGTGFHWLPHQLVGHAVEVVVHFDVIVPAHPDRIPFADAVRHGWKRPQRRPVESVE